MKKLIVFFSIALLASCGSGPKSGAKRPLYEVLTTQITGGGNIQFYEIVTEEKEIRMLQNDENLKGKIKPEDVKTANFVILNMGEKTTGGYSIAVDKVEETADKIIITVKETAPEPGGMATMMMSYPYTIVRINSKKPIEIK